MKKKKELVEGVVHQTDHYWMIHTCNQGFFNKKMTGSLLCCITLTCLCCFLPASNRAEDEVFKATWFIIVMVAIAILILVIIIVCLLLKRNRGDKYNGELYSFCYRVICDVQTVDNVIKTKCVSLYVQVFYRFYRFCYVYIMDFLKFIHLNINAFSNSRNFIDQHQHQYDIDITKIWK